MSCVNNDSNRLAQIARSRMSGQCHGGGDNGGSRPLNLFQGDVLGTGGGSGLFPRRPGGCGGLEDLLARVNEGKKKNLVECTNAANGLFSGGKDFGSASGSSASQGGAGEMLGQAMQGVQQVIGMVMNFVKAIMGIFSSL